MEGEAELTPNELVHLGQLIDLSVDLLSNRGCNDFPVPNTDENWALFKRMHKANDESEDVGLRPPKGERIWFMDWMLLRYLWGRLAEEATNGTQ